MPPETPALDLRAWAARQLGVPVDAAPDEVRTLFRRRLAEEDFLPPPEWQQAVAVLTGAELPAWVRVAAAFEEEERLREEVEAFAAQFFGWAPAERRRRWQELAERCAPVPALAARLRKLEPGLGVEADAEPDEAVESLAQQVRELFVLRPAERASRRQALLREAAQDPARWRNAAQQLRRSRAALAALEAAWLDDLSRRPRSQERLAKVRRRLKVKGVARRAFGVRFPRTLWIPFGVAFAIFLVGGLRELSKPSSDRAPATSVPAPLSKTASERGAFPKGIDDETFSKLGEATKRLLGYPREKARASGAAARPELAPPPEVRPSRASPAAHPEDRVP